MITVSPTKYAEIKAFNLKEWHGVDVEHYGKTVEWNEKDFLFKAEKDGEIVGTIGGKHESGVLYINTIIVARDHREEGIGRTLMERAEAFGRKEGAHKAHLITGVSWEAGKFYQSLGYQKIATLPDHHFHRDFVIFEKQL